MELIIISDSPSKITIENIEHIPPFEVNDTTTLEKSNFIFKELIYVR